MHRVVGVKRDLLKAESESGTGKSRGNQRGNTGAESREHRQGSKPGNPINIEHQNQKIKLKQGEGLANKTGKLRIIE